MSTDRLIINAAITGAVHNKSDCPHLPVTIDEIIECACRVREAGAAIIHLHAREADGSPSSNPDVYAEIVERIRQATDLIVCISLSGRFETDPETRASWLSCSPDMASLTTGSMNFSTQPSINSPETICFLAKKIHEAGAIPEIEIFETGFINYANYLITKGVLRPPHYFNIILGSLGSAPLSLAGLGHMVSLLPQGAIWSVGGLGRFQLDANVMAIAAGGHVRVGLEDNIYYDRARKKNTDNSQLISRIAKIGTEMGRPPASPDEVRKLLGIKITDTV